MLWEQRIVHPVSRRLNQSAHLLAISEDEIAQGSIFGHNLLCREVLPEESIVILFNFSVRLAGLEQCFA